MEGARIFILLIVLGTCLGAEEAQQRPSRSARTIARFFGIEQPSAQPQPQTAAQQQQQQQQHAAQVQAAQSVRKPAPLIYSVKYYDRTGEGEKVDVVSDHAVQDGRVQGVPARVFLNLYTGQQTPVYYDNKGQLLVPCPVYDHLYVAGVDQSLVRKPPTPSKVVQTAAVVPVPPPVSVPQIQAVPEIVYYASPSYVGQHNPVFKPNPGHGLTVVGAPFDYPHTHYFPGLYPYGSPGTFNPYVFIKPTPPGHHGPPTPTVQVQQPVAVTQVVAEKKEGDKLD